jgi:uncharacterized GH25 family protein
MTSTRRTALLGALLGAATLSAHFAWVETASTLKMGEPARIRIGYGHDLAQSVSAASTEGLHLWAVGPSGTRTDLEPAADGNWLAATFTPKQKGFYRFVFVQDRGVLSQTTTGYKAGGRDVYPDAKRSFKSWRTGSVYASTPNAKPVLKPLGLALEILAERNGKGEVILTVFRDGKPTAGVDVTCAVPGKTTSEKVGTSDEKGRVVANPAPGPTFFQASVSTPAPTGSNYDSENKSAGVLIQ